MLPKGEIQSMKREMQSLKADKVSQEKKIKELELQQDNQIKDLELQVYFHFLILFHIIHCLYIYYFSLG